MGCSGEDSADGLRLCFGQVEMGRVREQQHRGLEPALVGSQVRTMTVRSGHKQILKVLVQLIVSLLCFSQKKIYLSYIFKVPLTLFFCILI